LTLSRILDLMKGSDLRCVHACVCAGGKLDGVEKTVGRSGEAHEEVQLDIMSQIRYRIWVLGFGKQGLGVKTLFDIMTLDHTSDIQSSRHP